jgi:hypothetical protein
LEIYSKLINLNLEYRKGLSAKRIALKIESPSFYSKRYALCAMRHALYFISSGGHNYARESEKGPFQITT